MGRRIFPPPPNPLLKRRNSAPLPVPAPLPEPSVTLDAPLAVKRPIAFKKKGNAP